MGWASAPGRRGIGPCGCGDCRRAPPMGRLGRVSAPPFIGPPNRPYLRNTVTRTSGPCYKIRHGPADLSKQSSGGVFDFNQGHKLKLADFSGSDDKLHLTNGLWSA